MPSLRRQSSLLGAFFASLAACTDEPGALQSDDQAARVEQQPVVPEGFEQVDTQCNFHFHAPPEIRSIPAQGIDSCVLRFELPDCEITGGAGAYSERLASAKNEAEYERENVKIDGRSSLLVHYRRRDSDENPYVIALHVPISDKNGWYISIDFQASCSSPERRDEMRQVLLSVDPGETW